MSIRWERTPFLADRIKPPSDERDVSVSPPQSQVAHDVLLLPDCVGNPLHYSLAQLRHVGLFRRMVKEQKQPLQPFAKEADLETEAQEDAEDLYNEWMDLALGVSAEVHQTAEALIPRMCASLQLYWEVPPFAMLRTIRMFGHWARVAAKWVALNTRRGDVALAVLESLLEESAASVTTGEELVKHLGEVDQSMSSAKADVMRRKEFLEALETVHQQAETKIHAASTALAHEMAEAEAATQHANGELVEAKQAVHSLSGTEEYLQLYRSWVEPLRTAAMGAPTSAANTPGWQSVVSPAVSRAMASTILAPSESTLTHTQAAPSDAGGNDTSWLTAFPRMLQALLMVLSPPAVVEEPGQAPTLRFDESTRRRWKQQLLSMGAGETLRMLIASDVTRMAPALQTAFGVIIELDSGLWQTSANKAVVALGRWLSQVRHCQLDMAINQEREVEREEKRKAIMELEAQDAQTRQDLVTMQAQIQARQTELTKLSTTKKTLTEQIRRFNYVNKQGGKMGTYLRDVKRVVQERRNETQRVSDRLAGDLFLVCAAANYLGEVSWALRLEVMKKWRAICKDNHFVITSTGNDMLGVLSDPLQYREWSYECTGALPSVPLGTMLLPQHHSWLSSAAVALAANGWPLVVDAEGLALPWLQSVYCGLGVRVDIVPAFLATRTVIQRAARSAENDFEVSAEEEVHRVDRA
jgi:hypothetical protein